MPDDERLANRAASMPALIGGRLCLDFANTVEPRMAAQPDAARDYLTSYADLIGWSVHAGIVSEQAARQLLSEAQRHPTAARDTLTGALLLREAVYRVFRAVAQHTSPAQPDLDTLSQARRAAIAHAAIVRAPDGFRWTWADDPRALDRVVWPIADSAVLLLTEGQHERIKVCPGVPGDPAACAWLFYDSSKNRTRRWCSMEDCGSATKARQQTARRRSLRAQHGG
jgi:predicted RNA-binding Zn ribbon-like protein